MNNYTDWLNLDFDPFAPGSSSREIYCSGHRQQLLDQVVEFSLYSNAMIAVTGPLGSGKTTLAGNFCDRFAEEAVCIKIAATLFMNQAQFLEALQAGLPFKLSADAGVDTAIKQISQFAAELDLEARSLILIIDDAHELSAEVLELLTRLLESSVDASIHALMFGENQLDNLLQSTLSDEEQERLAVFPLEGFASDETREYIRFKLVAAGYASELPLEGGVVGAIHNSAQGMPGAINRLTADALNAQVPGGESHDDVADEDFGPMFSGERIEQLDELEEEEEEDGDDRLALAWIGGIQSRYWLSAAALVLLLTGTLLFWDTAPEESAASPIPVAVTPAVSAPAQPEPTVVPAAEPEPDPAPVATTAPVLAEPVQVVDVNPAAAEPEEPEEPEAESEVAQSAVGDSPETRAAPVQEIVAAVPQTPSQTPAATAPVEQIAEPERPVQTAAIAAASSFEERLLRASPQTYAVQLLASHSESNIREFVARIPGSQAAGYFETRHQGRPWFVALLATFDDRNQATQAISALPEDLRSNQPWVRSLAGIQNDIRELMSSALLSSQ